MAETDKKECPECKGAKIVPGNCVCDMEWRGNKVDDEEMDDCQCSPEQPCPECGGSGYLLGS
jgi:hypothetical protein